MKPHSLPCCSVPLLILFLVAVTSGGDNPGDLQALQGTWKGWVVEGKGAMDNKGVVQLQLIVKDDGMVATRLDGQKESSLGEGTFKLALIDKLKTIDALRASNPGKGQTYLGTYQIEGDTFRWCSATPGKERPTELVTRRGQFLMVLKRQPK